MKTISIIELHDKTDYWLRRVGMVQEIVATERGRPVARLLPPAKVQTGNPFQKRKLLPCVAALINRPLYGRKSKEIVSDTRD